MNMKTAARQAELIFPLGYIELIDAALAAGVRSLLLEGAPGTGKTALGRALGAQALDEGGVFIFAQANAWASDETLIRGVDLAGFVAGDEARVWAAGALLKASQAAKEYPDRPIILLIDEWDKTRPVADGLLLAALEERLVVDAAGNVFGELPENVLVWLTSNATRKLHPALMRRLLRICLPDLPFAFLRDLVQEQAGAGEHLASALASLTLDARRERVSLTLPDILRAARVLRHIKSVDTCRVLAAGLLRGNGVRRDAGADLWAALCRDGGAR